MRPQTAKLAQEKHGEDMMDLMMRMNQRIIHMEQELEKSVQDKQGESASQPPVVASTVPTILPTKATTIPPIIPPSIVDTTTIDALVVSATTTP